MIAPAYSAVCFLPDSSECGSGSIDFKVEDACIDKTTYTVAEFEAKFKFKKDCYAHFEYEKNGEKHVCVDEKNVVAGFNLDYQGYCCPIGQKWCAVQQACAEHCCPTGQEWCPAENKCVTHCCPTGQEWCERLGSCATKEECTPTCGSPKVYSPTLSDCVCPADRLTDKHNNCCNVGEILNDQNECVKKAVCAGYTESEKKDRNCWSCTACVDDKTKFQCTENVKDGYKIDAGKCVKKTSTPVSGCSGTEVLVAGKCVELAGNYPTKELKIENFIPFFKNFDMCPEKVVFGDGACPQSASTGTTGCRYNDSDQLKNLKNLWSTPLQITSIMGSNSRLKDIATIMDEVYGKICSDEACSSTVTLANIKAGKNYILNQRSSETKSSFMKRADQLTAEFREKLKTDIHEACKDSVSIYYSQKIGNCIRDPNSLDSLAGFIGNEYLDNTTFLPRNEISLEELVDYYKKNPWKYNRKDYIFAFIFSKDLSHTGRNIKLTGADEYAWVGNTDISNANYIKEQNLTFSNLYSNLSSDKVKIELGSFSAEGKGVIGNLYLKAKTITFAGGYIFNSTIEAETVTIKGSTRLDNVTIRANNLKFENNASLYVLGETVSLVRGIGRGTGTGTNWCSDTACPKRSFKKTEISGSAGALYVSLGKIAIYGQASSPVFSEIAVYGGKVQMDSGKITPSEKYSVRLDGQISLLNVDVYKYALEHFYYTNGRSEPQSGVDPTKYVVNDAIVGENEEICSVLTCADFGAFQKGDWGSEYADSETLTTACDGFTDKDGKSFECVKGSIPLYCEVKNEPHDCSYEIAKTYLTDWEHDEFCAPVSSEQDAQAKCQEISDNEGGYTILDVRVVGYGDKKRSKKCAVCLYDSYEK